MLAVKAHFLDQVVRDIDHLLGPDTMVLTVQNGLPWWYFQKLGGKYDNQKLESLDPTRHSHQEDRSRPPDRLRGLSGRGGDRAGRDPPRRGRPLPDRRARRQGDRARKRCTTVREGGPEVARACRTSARKSGSRPGAIFRSIRSARSPTRRWSTSASSPRPAQLAARR